MKSKNQLTIQKLVTIVMAHREQGQTELSKEIGISQSSLNRYIQGANSQNKSSIENYMKIEEYIVEGLTDVGETIFGSLNKRQKNNIENVVNSCIDPYITEKKE